MNVGGISVFDLHMVGRLLTTALGEHVAPLYEITQIQPLDKIPIPGDSAFLLHLQRWVDDPLSGKRPLEFDVVAEWPENESLREDAENWGVCSLRTYLEWLGNR